MYLFDTSGLKVKGAGVKKKQTFLYKVIWLDYPFYDPRLWQYFPYGVLFIMLYNVVISSF